MIRSAHVRWLALLALAPMGLGCGESTTTSVSATPDSVLTPKAPDEKAAPAPSGKTIQTTAEPPKDQGTAPAVTPVDLTAGSTPAPASPDDKITLVPIKYDDLRARITAKKAKLTLIDAWATWCQPCKEHFPDVVQMHEKYASQGLEVISLSLDEPTDPEALNQATQFLREKKAEFTNYLLNETQDEAFNKLNINVIPAVFVFGPDGKEVKRYTWEDPNNQFTYEQVEQEVVAMLKGQPPSAAPVQKDEAPKADAAKKD